MTPCTIYAIHPKGRWQKLGTVTARGPLSALRRAVETGLVTAEHTHVCLEGPGGVRYVGYTQGGTNAWFFTGPSGGRRIQG